MHTLEIRYNTIRNNKNSGITGPRYGLKYYVKDK